MDSIDLVAGRPSGNTTTAQTGHTSELAALRAEIVRLTERADALQAGGKRRSPSLRAIRARCRKGGSMRDVEFTRKTISAMEPPSQGEAFVWAKSPKGFGLRLSASGRRSYIVQFRIKGGAKSRRNTIGDATGNVTDESLAKAEKRARQILDRAREGYDLFAEEAAERERLKLEAEQNTVRSVGKIVEGYLAEPSVRKRRSFKQTGNYLSRHWRPIHGKSAETISRHDLAEVLNQVARERGPVAANRAQSAISSLFVHAMVTGVDVRRDDGSTEFILLRRESNPAALLKKRPERSRERVLSLDELGRLWRGVEPVDPATRAVTRLLVLTGCRLREVGELRWGEVDLEAAEIRLPGSRTKNARPHVIPLPPAAVEILEAMPRVGQLVFGTRSWGWAKERLDKAVTLDAPWTYHDLRRSLSIGMREHGVADGHLVELIINHASGTRGGVAGVYDRSERMADRRRALERWADLVQHAAGEDVAGAKVVAIR